MEEERDRVPTGRRTRWSQLAEKGRYETRDFVCNAAECRWNTRCWGGEGAGGEKTVSRH